MRKLLICGVLLLTGFGLVACGGSSSSDSPDVPTTLSFTPAMLNATYYLTDSDTVAGTTTQLTVVLNGSTGNVTEETFDGSGTLVSSGSNVLNITLNQDGTMTTSDSIGSSTLTLIEQTSTYLKARNVDDANPADTWIDILYFSKPAGWITTGSGSTPVFSSQLLNTTYYISWSGNGSTNVGTSQETLVLSGNGPYTGSDTLNYFDANGTFVSSEVVVFDVTLNQDGTLTFSDSTNSSSQTILSQTATYLEVHGIDNANTADNWTDNWYFSQPTGWLQ